MAMRNRIVSHVLALVEDKFQRLYRCFQGRPVHWHQNLSSSNRHYTGNTYGGYMIIIQRLVSFESIPSRIIYHSDERPRLSDAACMIAYRWRPHANANLSNVRRSAVLSVL